jgi:transcriptional regulator with XRE-family HTH domain
MPLDKQAQQAQKDLYIRFGQRVRRRREALGMSEEELGRRIGLKVERVRACEQGRQVVRVSLLEALVEALDISAAYFINDLEKAEEKEKPR